MIATKMLCQPAEEHKRFWSTQKASEKAHSILSQKGVHTLQKF